MSPAKSSLAAVLLIAAMQGALVASQSTATPIHNQSGVALSIDAEDHDPALTVSLPGGGPTANRTFKVLLPEHLTVRKQGDAEGTHLYLFQPGTAPMRPHWQQISDTLQYAADFGAIHFVARATLLADGILFRYDLRNRSPTNYDMAVAITDPRFHTIFFDPRLERTYVHYPDGFALLAADTPERLTLPVNQWFPVRYHSQFMAPIPAERVQRSDDGVTRRYAARRTDLPLLATISADGQWIAASVARDPGNVWSNPELTCQHVDEQRTLPPYGEAHFSVKLLLLRGTLNDALILAKQQSPQLP